jgi:hypothetical protein
MTTFTSDDREEEYKKILAEAPNQPGYEDAVPISSEDIKALEKGLEFYKTLKGNNASPPHIVDSGASVMIKELTIVQIACIYQQIFGFKEMDNLSYKFAMAVLKKAQEK